MSHCLGDIKQGKFCNQANQAPCREGKEQGEEPTLFITSVLVCQLSSGRAVHPGREPLRRKELENKKEKLHLLGVARGK